MTGDRFEWSGPVPADLPRRDFWIIIAGMAIALVVTLSGVYVGWPR